MKNCMKKIVSIVIFALLPVNATIIENGIEKKVVYVDMVADLFHQGHINMLKRAKEQGDYLVVGLMSDEDTACYKRRPICTLEERAAVVAACKYVDKVIPASPLRLTYEFIMHEHIDLVLHGDDMNQETLQLYYAIPMKMGILKTFPYTHGISTSDIIRRIIARTSELQ